MATRDLEENLFSVEQSLSIPETLLPSFPHTKAIGDAFPTINAGGDGLGKMAFLPWIDFALENPDEIWENPGPGNNRFYHYVSYLSVMEKAPAFVVEVVVSDDSSQVSDCSLVLRDDDMGLIRSGGFVYDRAKEWEREKLVRRLNDQALLKYDDDLLDEARELIDTAIKLSGPGSAYLYNNRGLISWKMGRTDQAKRDFLESINMDRLNGDPYFNIGLIYFDEADHFRALHYLRRAVEISPGDSQFLTELAHLYLELEREEDALKLFEKAFKHNPLDAQVDFHLGHYFLYKKRKPRLAVQYYGKGLKKDPNDQFALADLAIAHWVLGNRRKTLRIYKTLRVHPQLMPYTISRLVYLNMEMGEYENALEYYRRALSQKEPFEPEWLHYNAAVVYAKTGRPKQALDILNLAVKVGGEAVVKRAISDEALKPLTQRADFKRLLKLGVRRRTRRNHRDPA